MSKFYTLTVKQVNRETPDTVSIEFSVPDAHKNAFTYKQGQYLTFKFTSNGQEMRRSYSICSSPYNGDNLRVAVKEVPGGVFSAFANRDLKAGDQLESMPPMGNFYTELSPAQQKMYVGFAAGSGITPFMSIIKSVLEVEGGSRVHLVYGNKDENSVIFKKELEELCARYDRLKVTYVYSRQKSEDALFEGRIDKNKCVSLLDRLQLTTANEYFICGPEQMILDVSETLKAAGVDKKKIHFELFTTPVNLPSESIAAGSFNGTSEVTVLMDGMETSFQLESGGLNILDAAIDAGVDAPFSCKGAVCCTCKAKIVEGKAIMNMNYALSEEEVERGYILTCQAHPQSDKLVVDFDV